jgi:hypothetical protein
MSTQTLGFALTRTGRRFDWVPIFASNFQSCMLWATFTPFLLALGRRFRIERGVWPMHIALHLTVGVAFTMLDVYGWKLEAPYIRPGMPAYVFPFLVEVARQLLLDLGWLHHRGARARGITRRCRAESVRRAQLQSQLDAARLDALQSQLRPHFLFNTLTTIAEQVYGDPCRCGHDDRVCLDCSVIVRRSEVQEVTLRRSSSCCRTTWTSRVRFRERLTIDFDIHPNALDAFVPRFSAAVAENALHHGIEPMEAGGRLEIRVRVHQDT